MDQSVTAHLLLCAEFIRIFIEVGNKYPEGVMFIGLGNTIDHDNAMIVKYLLGSLHFDQPVFFTGDRHKSFFHQFNGKARDDLNLCRFTPCP